LRNLQSLEDGIKMSRKEIRENYKQYVNPGLANMMSMLDFDKHFVKAEGTRVWDEDDHEYLDFLGGYGSLNLGHNHPGVLAAIERVKGSPVLLQASLSKLASVLGQNLAQVTPGELQNTFFANSGAEAIEGALKLARAATGRKKLVYCEGGFHGKTFGALSVSGRKKYREPFEPLLPETREIPYGDIAALEEAIRGEDTAAFLLEPIQGEGGIIIPPEGYLSRARELCEKYGTLLIADEIQSGFGRTGHMFACDAEGVEPDVMCLSKFLGGGVMPVGAFITTQQTWNAAFGGMEKCLLHTSTYGGNTWGMAAGIASLNTAVEEDLPGQAREKGHYLMECLNQIASRSQLVKEVRGRGLLIGMEFSPISQGALQKISGGLVNKLGQEYLGAITAGELLNRHGIITAYTLNNPNVIRLEPPLNVTYQELDRVLEALQETLEKKLGGLVWNTGKTAVSNLFRRG